MNFKISIISITLALFSMNSMAQVAPELPSENTLVIVTATPDFNEKESMDYYAKSAHELLLKTEATGVSLYYSKEKIHGETAAFTFVCEFPDDQSVKGFFNGKKYQALMEYRYKGFQTFNVCIVTSRDPTIK